MVLGAFQISLSINAAVLYDLGATDLAAPKLGQNWDKIGTKSGH